MNKEKRPALEYVIYLSAAIIISLAGVMTPQFGFRTTDDSYLLNEYLMDSNQRAGSSVLGAKDTPVIVQCPQTKPIVGWLSYQGDKVLPSKLPPGENPSVCFESYEAAYQEGFVDVNY